jgi:hypothetical protein
MDAANPFEAMRSDPSAPIVLGAGISGLVAASILVKSGHSRVIVIDEYDRVGGNHIDRQIGDYTFDIGSLIFQDDSPLLAHLPEVLSSYTPIEPTWGRLNPQGIVTAYPISVKDDLIAAGPFEWMKIALSVGGARLFGRRLRNARDYARYWIGGYLLHRSGLDSYMRRFYGVPAERIELAFAEQRMHWIKEHAEIGTHVRRLTRKKTAHVANRQMARPKEGFAKLYDGSVKRLERDGVRFVLGTQLREIRRTGESLRIVTRDGEFVSDQVVSTIPVERALALCGLESKRPLESVTLISLFFSFAGERGFGDSVLYNFSHDGAWKRLTMYSDFYGKVNGRDYFTAEVNADHVDGAVTRAAEDFRDHTQRNGLFKGDLRLEGSHILSDAYPVFTDGATKAASEAVARLRDFGILSFGRQGGFEYQPTARVSTLVAEAAMGRGR